MARPRSNDPVEPMTLDNMRENGVRSLFVSCRQCHHRTSFAFQRHRRAAITLRHRFGGVAVHRTPPFLPA
jgi:hypothetical protein